mmetsp:Transcript_32451/g.65566  ORF Transcript_32451/g.65566 Transcript_32451/m.65566 type:complete len:222 (+) Transcript_32451:236-901(+)
MLIHLDSPPPPHRTVIHSGRPSPKSREAAIARKVPSTKSPSGEKSATAQEHKHVRMMDMAVLKHPRVAPAYLSMTAHRRPPMAFMAITETTRTEYPCRKPSFRILCPSSPKATSKPITEPKRPNCMFRTQIDAVVCCSIFWMKTAAKPLVKHANNTAMKPFTWSLPNVCAASPPAALGPSLGHSTKATPMASMKQALHLVTVRLLLSMRTPRPAVVRIFIW